MALIKEITLPRTGVLVDYWRLNTVSLVRDSAILQIEGFISKTAANADKLAVEETRLSIYVRGGSFATFFGANVLSENGKNPWGQAYAFLKSSVMEDRALQTFDLSDATDD